MFPLREDRCCWFCLSFWGLPCPPESKSRAGRGAHCFHHQATAVFTQRSTAGVLLFRLLQHGLRRLHVGPSLTNPTNCAAPPRGSPEFRAICSPAIRPLSPADYQNPSPHRSSKMWCRIARRRTYVRSRKRLKLQKGSEQRGRGCMGLGRHCSTRQRARGAVS